MRDDLMLCLQVASIKGHKDEVEKAEAYVKELEAKLAKAMATLECYAGYWAYEKLFVRTDDEGQLASETIKELTSSEATTKEGGKDE